MSKKTTKDENKTAGPREASRTHQLTQLEVGEYVGDVTYIPTPVAAGAVSKAKAEFNSLWAASVARAKTYVKGSQFKCMTFAALGADGDVAVSLVIQRIA